MPPYVTSTLLFASTAKFKVIVLVALPFGIVILKFLLALISTPVI